MIVLDLLCKIINGVRKPLCKRTWSTLFVERIFRNLVYSSPLLRIDVKWCYYYVYRTRDDRRRRHVRRTNIRKSGYERYQRPTGTSDSEHDGATRCRLRTRKVYIDMIQSEVIFYSASRCHGNPKDLQSHFKGGGLLSKHDKYWYSNSNQRWKGIIMFGNDHFISKYTALVWLHLENPQQRDFRVSQVSINQSCLQFCWESPMTLWLWILKWRSYHYRALRCEMIIATVISWLWAPFNVDVV